MCQLWTIRLHYDPLLSTCYTAQLHLLYLEAGQERETTSPALLSSVETTAFMIIMQIVQSWITTFEIIKTQIKLGSVFSATTCSDLLASD